MGISSINIDVYRSFYTLLLDIKNIDIKKNNDKYQDQIDKRLNF